LWVNLNPGEGIAQSHTFLFLPKAYGFMKKRALFILTKGYKVEKPGDFNHQAFKKKLQ
jgi:hypothetical protein